MSVAEHGDRATPDARSAGADILAVGFGTAIAMWALGYFARLFGDAVPAPLLFAALLLSLLAGGLVAGRWAARGIRGGVYAGLVTGLVNLLIVGSLVGGNAPNAVRAGAPVWILGTLLVSVLCGLLGAALGSAFRPRSAPSATEPDWSGAFAALAAGATVILLAAGGLVTGFDEGLAVVDWPNTEGYNMFLYPLAKMTGGVYLEHAHRLLGSLVGLTTLVLAAHTQLSERRNWVRMLAWAALAGVILQGILGGLRVTGRFTLSSRPADTDPKILLAIVHGIFGQIVLAILVALAVARSRRWQNAGATAARASASTDRFFGIVLVGLLIMQLALGALVRHFSWALDVQRYGLAIDPRRLIAIGHHVLMIHIAFAVLVALLAVVVGVRAWGLYAAVATLHRLGRVLLLLTASQVALGIAALIVTGSDSPEHRPRAVDVAVTTLHQVVGAALLAWTVMLVFWNYRLLASARRTRDMNVAVRVRSGSHETPP